jgi:hypothetical protein
MKIKNKAILVDQHGLAPTDQQVALIEETND